MPELTDFFPADTALRRHGWEIAARPNHAAALWRRGKVTTTEADAVLRLPDKVQAAVRQASGEDSDCTTESSEGGS